jgi:hypothetical protein
VSNPNLPWHLPNPSRGEWNLLSFGGVGNGVTDNKTALNAAITRANASPYGGEVFIPPGVWRITSQVFPKSNVTLRGAGRGVTTLLLDDALSNADVISNATGPTTFTALTNFHVRSLTLKGIGDTVHTQAAQAFRVSGTNLSLDDCELAYSRNMACIFTNSDLVTVRNCYVHHCVADGIAVWDTPNAIIAGNTIWSCNDDAISAHSGDATAAPVRGGLMILNNVITESQGIAVLGAKRVLISNNVLQRIMAIGIRVRAAYADVQGQTSQLSVRVVDNLVSDVFQRSEPSPRNLALFGIWIGGGRRQAGTGVSVPGEPQAATGTVTPLIGTAGIGTLYLNETGVGTTPGAAGHWLEVVGNHVVRTLPPVTNVSEWGYSTLGQWVGSNGDGSGYYNGPITAAAMRTDGISIDPALRNCRIANNTIQTGGANGIIFRTAETVVAMDFDGLVIENNMIADFSNAGIMFPATTTAHRMIVRGNVFDGDPEFRHANRKTGPVDGSWLATGAPYGLYLQVTSGVIVEGNHFRNVAMPMQEGGGINVTGRNWSYGDPAAVVFSTTNKGVGHVFPSGDQGWIHVIEDSDPASATYRSLKNTTLMASSGIPTAGTYVRGHKVSCTNPGSGVRAWHRLTTGSAHVLATDWVAV